MATAQTPDRRASPFFLSAVVILSLVVPMAIVYCTLAKVLNDKPFGALTREVNAYAWGSMKNGELWFPVFELPNPISRPERHVRIKRLNLETGDVSETGLQVESNSDDWGRVIWVGDHLYFYTNLWEANFGSGVKTTVYQAVGKKFIPLGLSELSARSVIGPPFQYHGQLSQIESKPDGTYCLIHWDGSRWIDGRQIRLPDADSRWTSDPKSGQWRIVEPAMRSTTRILIAIESAGTEPIVCVQSDPSIFAAYRFGFDLVDGESRLSDQNPGGAGQRQPAGWNPIEKNFEVEISVHSVLGELFIAEWPRILNLPSPLKLLRMDQQERIHTIKVEAGPVWSQIEPAQTVLMANPDEGTLYCLRTSYWKEVVIRRVSGDVLHAAHLHMPGLETRYLAYWAIAASGVFVAWLTHIAILIVAISMIPARCDAEQQLAKDPTIASPLRRLLAFAFDGCVILTLLLAYCRFVSGKFSLRGLPPSWNKLATDLHDVEARLLYNNSSGGMSSAIQSVCSDAVMILRNLTSLNFELLLVPIVLFVLMVAKWYLEHRIGTTPGKWLFRIRTVGRDLRSPTATQLVLRDLLLWCDIPLLITPLPAAISMMTSRSRQRLGDRLAGTIVVRC